MIDFKEIARQLRQPSGEPGIRAGIKMNEGNAFIYQCAVEALELKPGSEILEIGMGNGAFVSGIIEREKSVKYTGCDFSETMIEAALEINKTSVATGQSRLFLAAADTLPFPAGSFDSVFTINTIYFWDEPDSEISEIKRVLKKNGKFLVAIRPASTMKEMPFTQYGFHLYEKEEVETLLLENGFTIVQVIEKTEPVQYINGVPFYLETLIIVAELT